MNSDILFYISALSVLFFWLLAVGFFLVVLAKKYPLNSWSRDEPNPFQDETLSMPRGTIRAIIAISVLVISVSLEILGVIFEKIPKERIYLVETLQIIVAFYFGSKVLNHVTASEERTARDRARALVMFSNEKEKTMLTKERNELQTEIFELKKKMAEQDSHIKKTS